MARTHAQFEDEIRQRNHRTPEYKINIRADSTYESLDKPMWFTCANGHPDFQTKPRYIIQKASGCPKCGANRAGSKNTNTHESFISKLHQRNVVHDPVLLAPGSVYKGVHVKIKFMCPRGHPAWEATPASILSGHGCPMCGVIKSNDTHQYTHQQFLQLIKQRNEQHPTKRVQVVDGQQYKGYRQPLAFMCDYNHKWTTLPDNILNGRAGCPFCAQSKTFSHMAIEWLTEIEQREGIKIQHRGNSDKEYTIPGTKYVVDGFCPDTNTVYEFHGNYWHGNPRMYARSDINERIGKSYGELYDATIKKERVIQELGYNLVVMWEDQYDGVRLNRRVVDDFSRWTHNLAINVVMIPIGATYGRFEYEEKRKLSLSNGQQTIFVFEDEWVRNAELIKRKLAHYSSTNMAEKLHARRCDIRPCTSREKSALLEANHIQGNDNAQISYGAYHDNQLVAIMTFTSPRISVGARGTTREGVWELSRFCTDVNYRIPGIASKLLTHFKRNHTWTEIYSFADKRWSVGNMYHQLGFALVADNPPAYFYVIGGQRKHRWNYRKDVLKNTLPNYDPSLTEYQNMENHGFWRVWDCGTLKFSMVNEARP